MWRCWAAMVLACTLVWCGLRPAAAEAAWPMLPWLYRLNHPSYQPDNPSHHFAWPSRPAEPAYGQYPWYGTAWGVPTYNWGHFGAPSDPACRSHKTYYGDCLQWSQRRQY